jgi:hypothetical protein
MRVVDMQLVRPEHQVEHSRTPPPRGFVADLRAIATLPGYNAATFIGQPRATSEKFARQGCFLPICSVRTKG